MQLGDRVLCSAVLWRRTEVRSRQNDRKYWDTKTIEPREGVYIGMRTLANGERWWEDEVGYVFEPKEHFRAALVVFSERENPVLIPLDALQEAQHG